MPSHQSNGHEEAQRFKGYDADVRAPMGAREISAEAAESLRLFVAIGLVV